MQPGTALFLGLSIEYEYPIAYSDVAQLVIVEYSLSLSSKFLFLPNHPLLTTFVCQSQQ